jgi:EthD domain
MSAYEAISVLVKLTAEVWLDSMDDFYKAFTSKSWHDVIQKDELDFVDPSKTQILISEEKVNFKA